MKHGGQEAAALIFFKLLKTKRVHYTNFQLNTKPMLAMNFALSSFGQPGLMSLVATG
jgi:hypothetical protein